MTPRERDAPTPEADALEQEAGLTEDDAEDGAPPEPSPDPEAPEADALEQAQEVPLDEEEEPR